MLKHMLTHTANHPKTGSHKATPSSASVPNMDDVPHGSPLLESRVARIRSNNTGLNPGNGDLSGRPVSVHGNVISNQSIYANTVSVPKMNGGLNISHSAPSANR